MGSMMVKMLFCNSRFGKNNKGFILSLDILIATFLAFIVITISVYYVGLADDETLSSLQLLRTGSDILAVMDYEKTLNSLDKIEIQNKMDILLPPNYGMLVSINGTFPQRTLMLESTTEPVSNKFVVGGKRSFVIYNETNEYFATADFLIWIK